MNKNKVIKLLAVLFIVAIVVFTFTNSVFAIGPDANYGGELDPESVTGKTDNPAGNSVAKMVGVVISVTQIIAIGVAVIMLAVLAIKYMSAAPNDKAEIKKHAVVYVVGAIVLFGATGILQIIKQFADSVNNTAKGTTTTTTTD